MKLSVVIPTHREASQIDASVRRARAIGDEVIVVDGGSDDGTPALALEAGATVITAPRGRGGQLAAGAAASSGDVMLFLHADVMAPASARPAIEDALSDASVVGGNFALRFTPSSASARVFGWANHVRRRWLAIYYGDSGVFVRREVYERIGGFRQMPLFEDHDFVQRLERAGRTAYVREVVLEASARRFERAPVRTLVLWSALQVMYSLGAPPEVLARAYRR